MVEWKKLGDICEIKGRIGFRGYTRDDQVDKGKGAISLSPGNIDNGSMNYESCTYITWDKYEESPEIIVNEGDIILCKTASVGKVARIRHLPEKATINPQLVLIKNIQSNPQYLFYVLDDKPFQSKIKGLAGIGSVPNVSQAKLSAIEIPIPSLFEQTRIVGILDTFTSAIDNLKEQIAQRRKQYEYYRDQLLDLEGKPGVEMKTLGEMTKVLRGKRLTKNMLDEEAPYPVFHGGIEPLGFYSQYNREANTVMIINVGASAGTVGYCDRKFWSSDGCFCISQSDSINNKFLYYYLETKTHYLQSQVRHAGIPTLDNPVVEKIYVPLLTLSEQKRIVSILDTFETSIQNLEAQLKEREKQYEYYRNKLLTFE